MSKYKDINTGEEYDEIPIGKVQPIIVNGQPVTERAYNKYYNSHPIQLEEYIVTPQKENSTTLAAYYDRMAGMTPNNYINHVNNTYNDNRIRRSNYWEGIFNVASPSQIFGAYVDYQQGERPFLEGLWYGNSGWVPDNFANKYPRISTLANMIVDGTLGHGINTFYKWGTTQKLIGEGASKRAYSSPFSRKVYFEGADPAYIQEQNNFPGSLQYKLERYDIDGKPIYSAPKVRMVSKPSKNFIKNAINKQFFPTKVFGDTETVFINPTTQKVMLDAEWGKTLFGKTYVVDPEILSIQDYLGILKQGGKIICHQKKKTTN